VTAVDALRELASSIYIPRRAIPIALAAIDLNEEEYCAATLEVIARMVGAEMVRNEPAPHYSDKSKN
jgi:hypothetical protein